jgi:hypothetical protein
LSAVLLINLRQAVTDQIGAWFAPADCATCPSPLTEAEAKTTEISIPAIRVACLGMPKAEAVGDGEVDRDVSFSAYILTSDTPTQPRGAAALAMVEDLLLRLPGQSWGIANVFAVADSAATATNLSSRELSTLGRSLWEVAWTQRIRMGENSYPNGPVLSSALLAGGEVAP